MLYSTCVSGYKSYADGGNICIYCGSMRFSYFIFNFTKVLHVLRIIFIINEIKLFMNLIRLLPIGFFLMTFNVINPLSIFFA